MHSGGAVMWWRWWWGLVSTTVVCYGSVCGCASAVVGYVHGIHGVVLCAMVLAA